MLLVAFASLTLAGAPQGVSVRLEALVTSGASVTQAEQLSRALSSELTKQGYEVVPADDAKRKAMAVVRGTLTKTGDGFLVSVMLLRAADDRVLDDVKLEAKSGEALAATGSEVARRVATAIRSEWGVRARVKF